MTKSRRNSTIGVFVLFCAAALGGPSPAWATPRSAVTAIEVTAAPNPTHIPLKVGSLSSAIALGLTVGPGATAGELAGSAESAGKDATLTQRVADRELRLGDEFAKAIEEALKKKGLNAFLAGSPVAGQTATARVSVSIEEAGYERRVWGKIGPKLTVRARLYEASSGDRLWGDTYVYDMYAQTLGWTMVRPPEEYGFDEPEDVLAHPDVVVAGLRTGVHMIADHIAEDIVADLDD
jgi:hypothetical protein